ncbi:MAG: pitrilysin family protein [Oscillospiraceae bacterium]|nr:pitrilysin family protein [Oscillospiraceae bacterium]
MQNGQMDIKPRRKVIGNNIAVNLIKTDKYKTNFLTFYFLTTLTEKSASYTQLISRIITRACAKYPTSVELNRTLDDCYGAEANASAVKHGEYEVLGFSLSTLADKYAMDSDKVTDTAVDICAEMLFKPYLVEGGFDKSIVESEKVNVKDAISAEINNKSEYARKRMIRIMCEGEAYAINPLGYPDIVDEADGVSLYEFYRELIKTSRVEIFFAGICDEDRLVKKLSSAFSNIGRAPACLPETHVISTVGEIKRVTEQMPVTQSHLVMGFRTGITTSDRDFRAFSLYNSVLGGSLTSKLFMNVREKLSLCYTVNSMPDAAKGIMRVYAGIDDKKFDAAYDEIMRQMKLISDADITDSELRESKNALINSLNSLPDNPGALASWFLPRILNGLFDETPLTVAEEIEALTKEEVVAVSSRVKLDTVYLMKPDGTVKPEEEEE